MEKYRILKNLFFSVFASKITNKFVFRRDYIHKYTDQDICLYFLIPFVLRERHSNFSLSHQNLVP